MQNKNKIVSFLSTYFPHSITLARVLAIILIVKAFTMGALFFVRGEGVGAEGTVNPQIIIEQTNDKRVEHGLAPLQTNNKLIKAASYKAEDIVAHDYFAHTTPKGKPFYRWIQESGYTYTSAGENLAISFAAPEEIIAAWMMSQTHRENILDPHYKEIGIAVASGEFQGKQTVVVVQLFGEPR